MNQLGVYEKTLAAEMDLSSLLDEATNACFDFFELAIDETPERIARLEWTATQRDSVRRKAEENGLDIHVVTLSAHRGTPLGSANPSVRRASRQMLDDAIDLASDLGASIVQIAGYFVFYEPHHELARDYFIDGLAHSCDRAAAAGVTLALENVDGHDVISIADGLTVVEELAHPSLGLCADVGNLAANQLDVLAELRAALPHLVAVDLKDSRVGEYRRVPFGEGLVPFAAVFSLLREVEFAGPYAVEMWNDDHDASVPVSSRQWLIDHMEPQPR